MPIEIVEKVPLPRTNVLIRLNPDDTKFLLGRVREAVRRGTGVNLILESLRAAACLIESKERGKQISLNTYSDSLSYRVETPMKGYNGPWSHIELVMNLKLGRLQLEAFTDILRKEAT